MKIAILSANLGNFDKPVNDVFQEIDADVTHWRFTDDDFPPIIGLTPRLQYRIPKMFGWQFLNKENFGWHDYILWLDSSMSLQRPDSLMWFLEKCKNYDMALFKHPWRSTITEETNHIEEKLKEGNKYITSRYKNGLHKEQLAECLADSHFEDNALYASTAFIYKNNQKVHDMMWEWWKQQSRYFTVDQISLPYAIFKSGLNVNVIEENIFKNEFITLTSKHK